MITDLFSSSRDGFDILGLRAHFDFKTATSIGFQLGSIPKGPYIRIIFGALQVHHPCDGHIKARIYVQLPRHYSDHQLLRKLCEEMLGILGIPADDTYELHYHDAADSLQLDQRVNREGIVDQI